MTDTTEISPEAGESPRKGFIGLGYLREIGILAAATSLLLLSTHAFGLQYVAVFQGMLDWLEDNIGKWFEPLEGVLKLIIAKIGIDLHLQKHWRYAFVLLWLLHSSWARNFGKTLSSKAFIFAWGAFTALVASAAVGTVPLDSAAVAAWPWSGACIFLAGVTFWLRGPLAIVLGGVAMAAFFAWSGYTAERPMETAFSVNVPSPGLLVLAAVIASASVGGFLFGLIGSIVSERSWHGAEPGLDIVIDVWGAMGVAALLAIVGLGLPS